MYLTEQYYMYRLAYYFVSEQDYEMLYINNERDEVWLEKNSRKGTDIIRFIHHGFDWKNHLKSDIASVFQRVKMMKGIFTGKNINIYNIYVTEHEPVDDWESLKKTMVLKDKKPLHMNIFYLSGDSLRTEESRLFNKIDITPIPDVKLPDTNVQEKESNYYKAILNQLLKQKTDEFKNIFTFGKPRLTYLFILMNFVMFLLLEINGGSTNIETLVEFGAKYNPAIIDGQWWRIITSMFLHIGVLHLAMNMIALYYLGAVTERIFGSWRFFVIYLLAGVGGGIVSFAFNTHISAGASGALFGLFGALLFFGAIHKRLFQQTMGKNIILILMINLALGLFIPQIDMGAHLGGMICGFLAAAITYMPKRNRPLLQLAALAVYLCIIVVLYLYGVSMVS